MTDDYLIKVGSLIRDARRHKGMSQCDLAKELGTSQGAVTRIESGKQNLSLEMLARIGEAARAVWNGDAERVLAHATGGHALQQNLIAVMEAK